MCVLISTDIMQAALLFSMKPMPPMSAAGMYTCRAPSTPARAVLQERQVGGSQFSAASWSWYPLVPGLDVDGADGQSPGPTRAPTRCPPIESPATGNDDVDLLAAGHLCPETSMI